MEQAEFASTSRSTKLEALSKEELIQQYTVVEAELERLVRELYELRNKKICDEQLQLILQEQIETLKKTIFGKKSERWKKKSKGDSDGGPKDPPKPRIKKPSERYPNIPVREETITINPVPCCKLCNKNFKDTGLRERIEQLTVIPKKYEITAQNRVIYGCQCECGNESELKTAPTPARIIPGATYSDEMLLDIALSKYCDLIPINRYAEMAKRSGLIDLPKNSLVETTHGVADFYSPVYKLIKKGALEARVLNADETPHRMLEGDEKRSWYLWGFSTPTLCYLECRDTRSGDVASNILTNSKCEILVSDRYAGYDKATRVANKVRQQNGLSLIKSAHCNAHARRCFYNTWPKYKEAEFYLEHYHEIYDLNSKAKGQAPPIVLALREQMRPRFEAMKKRALEELSRYPRKGNYGRALRYFLKNYNTLTLFLTDAEVPIDNNRQEGNLRNPVIGRKTWYGTHSKRGALTAAILFTIVETCRLNNVNPREYFAELAKDMLAGAKPYTPVDYKKSH